VFANPVITHPLTEPLESLSIPFCFSDLRNGLHGGILPEKRTMNHYGKNPTVRIITVTLTAGRRDGLTASAAEVAAEGYYKYFYFGALEDLSFDNPASIFDPAFVWLKDRSKRSIA
jgi:hypothetical protein